MALNILVQGFCPLEIKITQFPSNGSLLKAFLHDVTSAMLVSQNNETAAMVVSQTSLLGVKLFSDVGGF